MKGNKETWRIDEKGKGNRRERSRVAISSVLLYIHLIYTALISIVLISPAPLIFTLLSLYH